MQKLLVLGWLVLLPTVAHTQSVTPADLEGYAVDTRVVMDQRTRSNGRDFNVQMHFRAKIAFEPDDVILFELSSIGFGPRGSRQAPARKGRALLGKVTESRNHDGGQAVWTFENGALTTLRIYGNAGGFKRTISFMRDGADAFSCKIEAAYLREDGVGRVAFRSAVDNAPVAILSSKQASSSCKVSKARPG
jgi:hypothetical protein